MLLLWLPSAKQPQIYNCLPEFSIMEGTDSSYYLSSLLPLDAPKYPMGLLYSTTTELNTYLKGVSL